MLVSTQSWLRALRFRSGGIVAGGAEQLVLFPSLLRIPSSYLKVQFTVAQNPHSLLVI